MSSDTQPTQRMRLAEAVALVRRPQASEGPLFHLGGVALPQPSRIANANRLLAGIHVVKLHDDPLALGQKDADARRKLERDRERLELTERLHLGALIARGDDRETIRDQPLAALDDRLRQVLELRRADEMHERLQIVGYRVLSGLRCSGQHGMRR